MKTDWPEIIWFGLFAATGLIGILIMLPTNDQVSVVRWIEALGGWGAALIAVPSIILLLRQTSHAGEQARQARLPALTARATILSAETQFISGVLKHLATLRLDYPNISVRFKDDAEGLIVHTINTISAFRSYIGEVGNEVLVINTRNPSNALGPLRESFVDSFDIFKAGFEEFEKVLDAHDQETLLLPFRDRVKEVHRKVHDMDSFVAVAASAREWQKAVAIELGRTQREMDTLAGLH